MKTQFVHHGIECSVKWAGTEIKPHNAGDDHVFIGISNCEMIRPIFVKSESPEKAINRAKTELRRAIDIHFANRF